MAAGLFGAVQLQINDIELRNGTVDPGGAAVNAPIGSWFFRNGAVPATPTEIYMKTGSPDVGWTKQNYDLRVFNIIDYGAVPDGVTNNDAFIEDAITAAIAAGGGIIYVPPGVFAVTKSGITNFDLNDRANLIFFGDGASSVLKMIGSAAFGDWYMFRIRNGSSGIRFHNLAFESDITDPDPSEQNHFIQISGTNPDNQTTSDIEVYGCWFDTIVGDAVRMLAEVAAPIVGVRIINNAFDMPGCRAPVSWQRNVHNVQCHFNWMTGSDDNEIDFEPTGVGDNQENSIIGNMVDHLSRASAAITLSGNAVAQTHARTVFGFNIITNGGHVQAIKLENTLMICNVITVDSVTTEAVWHMPEVSTGCSWVANVAISLSAAIDRPAFNAQEVLAPPGQLLYESNLAYSENARSLFSLSSVSRLMVLNNLCFSAPDALNVGFALQNRAITAQEDTVFNGNLIVTLGVNYLSFIGMSVDAAITCRNGIANGNYGRGAFSGCRWGNVVLGQRANCDNMFITTDASVEPNAAAANGVMIAGVGSGPQIVQIPAAAGPNGGVASVIGSVVSSTAGTNGRILWRKESGSGTSGWVNVGGGTLVFGARSAGTDTAARFFAPGFDQTTVVATELQIPLPRTGIIRNMRIQCTAGTGGGNVTYTVRINGGNTTLASTFANTSTSASNTSNTATVTAGDLMSVRITKASAPVTGQSNIIITFDYA